jgi:hypothetical protein
LHNFFLSMLTLRPDRLAHLRDEPPVPFCLRAVKEHAPKFAAALEEHDGDPFDNAVSLQAFEQFIRICEGREITPTADTCYDLFCLALTYDAEFARTRLTECVRDKPEDLAIPAIRFYHEVAQQSAKPFEQLLYDQYRFLKCSVADLSTLNPKVLARIIHFPPESDVVQFQRVFDLVWALSGTFEERIMPLYHNVNLCELSERQLRRVRSLNGFDVQWFDTSGLVSLVDTVKDLQERFETLETRSVLARGLAVVVLIGVACAFAALSCWSYQAGKAANKDSIGTTSEPIAQPISERTTKPPSEPTPEVGKRESNRTPAPIPELSGEVKQEAPKLTPTAIPERIPDVKQEAPELTATPIPERIPEVKQAELKSTPEQAQGHAPRYRCWWIMPITIGALAGVCWLAPQFAPLAKPALAAAMAHFGLNK